MARPFQENLMSFQHTVIVGGSSGIGLATARHLLACGARVTITGRNEIRLAEARRALGPKVQALPMDATAADALPDQFARIGRFDHLVLALGSGRGVGPFATADLADVKLGFEEKVYAHFATAQAALPFLSPTGSLTFVSAVSAHAAVPGTAGIGAANAAVAALVPVLAVELKPLRVNGVSPGVIDTPWWDVLPEGQKQAMFKEFAAKTPVGRVGRPEDIAKAIAFLIDDDFITGHTLVCDGGLRFAA
jgi:NAD(P)-dependent dehydrogenase (short-subunit alcohol dehydrogenase family)